MEKVVFYALGAGGRRFESFCPDRVRNTDMISRYEAAFLFSIGLLFCLGDICTSEANLFYSKLLKASASTTLIFLPSILTHPASINSASTLANEGLATPKKSAICC